MRKLTHEEIPRADPSAISSLPRHPIHVILHDIRSIHNVGSMFRTADAAGVAHIYLTGYTGTPEHRALHKTALGAQDAVPWTHTLHVENVLDSLQTNAFTLAALEITDTPSNVADLQIDHFPICLVVGNEVEGVPQPVLDRCDLALEIPQYGVKQSLNVSVAFGIAVFGVLECHRRLVGSTRQP